MARKGGPSTRIKCQPDKQEKVTLRYDPAAAPGRPVQVWHEGRREQLAKVVDAYANCFVKRHRPSRTLTTDTPADTPPPGLPLRRLDRDDEEEG